MPKTIRTRTRLALERSLRNRAKELSGDDLAKDAWVIAPHPDDETLGCGGTIAAKLERGARVSVVFVSDGSRSHVRWMSRAELGARREAEGREACRQLGVRAEDVHFLELPDGQLSTHVERGTASLANLFSKSTAQQFFIPHRREPPVDHASTAKMAMSALRSSGLGGTVLEYPVWLWARWPWVPRRDDPAGGRAFVHQAPRIAKGVLELAIELRCRVDVLSHLERKTKALACHETQTRRPENNLDWPILSDIADGEFMERFFCGSEYFRRSELSL